MWLQIFKPPGDFHNWAFFFLSKNLPYTSSNYSENTVPIFKEKVLEIQKNGQNVRKLLLGAFLVIIIILIFSYFIFVHRLLVVKVLER